MTPTVKSGSAAPRVMAALRELELAQASGAPVDAKAVERIYRGKVIAARARLLAIPAKLAARLADETEPRSVQDALSEEIHAALEELAADARADFDAAARTDAAGMDV